MSELVLCETRNSVAILTLNRPEKLNALNYALVDRLKERLDAIEGDSNIRAVILTGAGERAFSAGADITEFSETLREGPDAAVRAFVRRGQSMTARIESFQKPIIVAVNGIAFGGGCEITEPPILRSQARRRASPSRKSISGFRRRSAARNDCLAWRAASARWSCCSPGIRFQPGALTR
jgi:hypothetical protein